MLSKSVFVKYPHVFLFSIFGGRWKLGGEVLSSGVAVILVALVLPNFALQQGVKSSIGLSLMLVYSV